MFPFPVPILRPHQLLLVVAMAASTMPGIAANLYARVLYQGPDTTLIRKPLAPPTLNQPGDYTPDPVTVRRGLLPVRTPELTPARIQLAPFTGAFVLMPICVVGSDDFSVSWLESRRDQLVQAGAFCRLVQAETPNDVRRVRRAAGAVMVYPGNGADLVSYYGLRHYPVLISKDWVEQ